MPPHDFEHECPRVRNSGRMYVIDCLADSVQRRWCADCEIGHGHVIVDRSNESYNSEVPMARDLLIRNAIWPGLTGRLRISRGRKVGLTNLAIGVSGRVPATRT